VILSGLAPHCPLPQSVTGHLGWKFNDYMLVLCQNCMFVHMTNKIFPVTRPLRRPMALHWNSQSGVLEQHLVVLHINWFQATSWVMVLSVTPWRFIQRMPTYDKFGEYVAINRISYVYDLNKLTARWNTMVYVVVRRNRRKILCMHKISRRMAVYGFYVVGTLCDCWHVSHTLLLSWS